MSLVHALAAASKQVELSQLLFDILRQRLHLRHGAARCDHHIIGDDGHFVNLEHHNILAALRIQRFSRSQRNRFLIHVISSFKI